MATGHFSAAVITGLQIATEDRHRAVLDGPHHAALLGAEGMGTPVRLPVFPKDSRQRARSGPSYSASWPTKLSGRGVPLLRERGQQREIPDHHPLVRRTLRHCLGEIERGETRVIARDLTSPRPLISKDVET
jgi:hypothetical protein